MKTKIFFLLMFLSTGLLFTNAQQNRQHGQNKRFDIEEYRKKRDQYLIKEVGLTNEEAKQFLPLTNELMKKKYELNKAVREEGRELMKKKEKTEDEYETLLDKNLDIRIKEAQLEKEYYQKFKKVLSAEKLYKYMKAEMKFTKNFVRERERPKQ